MTLTLLSGRAHPALAADTARRLGMSLGEAVTDRFPDGELQVQVMESVRGGDVYIIQPTCPPVADNLLELLLLADACRRAGASRITGVVPYFGYARQDRRASGRQPVGARLVADLIAASGVDRLVSVDVHTPAVEGFSSVPMEHLSAVPLLAKALKGSVGSGHVVVAPDLGAVKLAERFSNCLGTGTAFVQKTRLTGERVEVRAVVGEVAGRPTVIVDDMITTGGTIASTAAALREAGCLDDVTVVATHGVLVGPAEERLRSVRPTRLLLTDSASRSGNPALPIETVTIAPLLADAIDRLHHERSLADLMSFS